MHCETQSAANNCCSCGDVHAILHPSVAKGVETGDEPKLAGRRAFIAIERRPTIMQGGFAMVQDDASLDGF